MNSGIASVLSAFEAKFERMQKRLEVLESDVMDRENQVQGLADQLARQIQINSDLQAQVEGMDMNRRLSSLIFTCDEFGRRSATEDIEERVVALLNDRVPGLNLSTADIHAAHRLQRDEKVIVKFVKRSVRDRIYDARFALTTHGADSADAGRGPGVTTGTRGGRRPALFISESLTPFNQWIFGQLLHVRKSSGGTKVASVFSQRGIVFCRTVKGGPNIRVPDEDTLWRIIGSTGSRSAASDRSVPAAGGRPGRPGRDAPVPGAVPAVSGDRARDGSARVFAVGAGAVRAAPTAGRRVDGAPGVVTPGQQSAGIAAPDASGPTGPSGGESVSQSSPSTRGLTATVRPPLAAAWAPAAGGAVAAGASSAETDGAPPAETGGPTRAVAGVIPVVAAPPADAAEAAPDGTLPPTAPGVSAAAAAAASSGRGTGPPGDAA